MVSATGVIVAAGKGLTVTVLLAAAGHPVVLVIVTV
jgi:hypothetical protein